MALLVAPAVDDQREVRDLAKRMMAGAIGAKRSTLAGALAVCVAGILIQQGDGEDDVEAFSAYVRKVIADTKAARGGKQ